MTKFSGITPNSSPALGDYLIGVTSGNVDDRVTIQNLVNLILKSSLLSNPYKFLMTRAAALNCTTTVSPVQFDTKQFDTSGNCDVTTNKGRFTAPVTGFYSFTFAGLVSATTGDHFYGGIMKNGSEYMRFFEETNGSSINTTNGIAIGPIQLSAGDYVEIYYNGSAARAYLPSASAPFYLWFAGKLDSVT